MPTKTALTSQAIDKVIRKNLKQFDKAGVLTVRPGFEIAGDQFTGQRAVVATVHTKKLPAGLSKSDLLPTKVSGIPVDVREATPHQRLRAHDPAAAALAQAFSRQHDREPVWAFEREIPSGKLVSHPTDTTPPALLQFAAAHLATASPPQARLSPPTRRQDHGSRRYGPCSTYRGGFAAPRPAFPPKKLKELANRIAAGERRASSAPGRLIPWMK